MLKKSDSTIKMVSYADDLPQDGRGTLIPRKKTTFPKHTFAPALAQTSSNHIGTKVVVLALAIFSFLVISVSGYGVLSQVNLASAPSVTILDPYTQKTIALDYGPQVALANSGFFNETRDAFIAEGLTFIELYLPEKQMRFFKNGVLYQSAEILATGESGSWWDTPSGLYKVEKKENNAFVSINQIHLPWKITFQSNFAIHGWPLDLKSRPVTEDFIGGGVRLASDVAEALFHEVKINTPILVYATETERRDSFIYEPMVPELTAPHYFIADIENGTILAANSIYAEVPIASITKLMTAVVAAEQIDLNSRVRVTSPTFVMSLIPRLSDRGSVSMYSLLQLLLVESSNEAAETIAGEIGREKFIENMNVKARQIGMMNSNFADPSGLSAENTSTVADLYKLIKYIYDKRSFILEISANKKVPSAYVGDEFSDLINFNEIKELDNFVGGKVGETLAAGQTSASLHKIPIQGEERIIAIIVLGSSSRVEDVQTLVSYIQQRFSK